PGGPAGRGGAALWSVTPALGWRAGLGTHYPAARRFRRNVLSGLPPIVFAAIVETDGSTMTLRLVSFMLGLILAAASIVVAAPADDGYIEGYAAAVLQREFALAAPSLRVQQGVITVDAADLAGVDQAAVLAQLSRIPGVARVEVRPVGAPPPPGAPPPAAPPAP